MGDVTNKDTLLSSLGTPMQPRIKKLSIRLLVLLVIFAIGVTVMLLCAARSFRTVPTAGALKASDALRGEQVAVPEEWKKFDIKNRVTIRLPQDMKPSELIGDSYAYREAYSNRDIEITIAYGAVRPPRLNQKGDQFDPCETRQSRLQEPTYHESVIELDGRKAKLRIDRYHQPKFILADVCFLNPPDRSEQLIVLAFCKNEHALETAQQIFNSIRFNFGKQ
jgi:hypothetical protein